MSTDVARRAQLHAAVSDPTRLRIVDDLAASDRSPSELGARLGIGSNLLAHHLDVLEHAGIIQRFTSAGDGRRRYVRLAHDPAVRALAATATPCGDLLFVCSHNSARSQLAAAIWGLRVGTAALSAGTHPAARVHPGAIAAGHLVGVDLRDSVPRAVDRAMLDDPNVQVVTVCDQAHEELSPTATWWHWSIADPVPPAGTNPDESTDRAAFDAVVADIGLRISSLIQPASTTGVLP